MFGVAGHNQISKSRQAKERQRLRAHRGAKPRHLKKSTCEQSGFGVVSQLKPINNTTGHRVNIFKAAAQFNTHRSEEHTSELQSRVDISYAVFCLKKKQ